jgi:hypothetical protein
VKFGKNEVVIDQVKSLGIVTEQDANMVAGGISRFCKKVNQVNACVVEVPLWFPN